METIETRHIRVSRRVTPGAALAPLASREQIDLLADLEIRRLAGLVDDRARIIAVEETDLEPDKRAVPTITQGRGLTGLPSTDSAKIETVVLPEPLTPPK